MLSKAMNEQASGAVAVEADQASALEVWLRYKPPASRIVLRQNPDGLTMTIPREALAHDEPEPGIGRQHRDDDVNEVWHEVHRGLAGSAKPESIGLAMARYQGGYCHLENGDGAAAAERLAASRVFFEHLMEQSGPLGRLGRQYFRQSHFNQIAAHAVAGQNDEAFALIHEAINKYGVPPAAIAEDLLESPKMKNLLDDPRFEALKN